MKKLAPIILFCYNRPEHLLKTLIALKENDLANESELYVYCDGPKNTLNQDEKDLIEKTREIVRQLDGFKSINVIYQSENLGLAKSIVQGVSDILRKFDSVIVLEDDIVTEEGFLIYMNECLRIYKNEDKVMHVSAYMYPINNFDQNDIFFCNILSCWGWATWRRSWKFFEDDVNAHINRLNSKKKIKDFNIYGAADFYEQLILNKNGKINSWAVKWYASWKYNGGYSIFPKSSLVKNIGHDGSGVHCYPSTNFDSKTVSYLSPKHEKIKENLIVKKRINNYYKKIYGIKWHHNTWLYKMVYKPLRSYLGMIKRAKFN